MPVKKKVCKKPSVPRKISGRRTSFNSYLSMSARVSYFNLFRDVTVKMHRYWPKTTIARPSDPTRQGPATVEESFGWAKTFLKDVQRVMPSGLLADRLRKWKWNLETCFSGVGCAEAVPRMNNRARYE